MKFSLFGQQMHQKQMMDSLTDSRYNPLKKSQQYRIQIRRQDLENKKKEMRQILLEEHNPDYTLLSSINLYQNIRQLSSISGQRWKNVQQFEHLSKIISNLFFYSTSQESDHMYILFDDKILLVLSEMIQDMLCPFFRYHDNQYKKILWIMSNYTCYNDSPPIQYFNALVTLWNHSFEDQQIPHTFLKKIGYLQPLLSSLVNLTNKLSFVEQNFISTSAHSINFLSKIINIAVKIGESCKQRPQQAIKYSHILIKIYNIFQNVVKLIQIFHLPQIQAIIELMITHFQQFEAVSSLSFPILQVFRGYVLSNITNHPEVVLKYNWSPLIKSFCCKISLLIKNNFNIFNFHNLLDVEGQQIKTLKQLKEISNHYGVCIEELLRIFQLFYGFNIPSDSDEDKYYQLLENWLNEYLIDCFFQIFKINDQSIDRIKEFCLAIISNMMLEERFCEYILDDLTIMSKIFYYSNGAESFRLKINALLCLSNMVKIAFDGESSIRQTVLEFIQNNNFIETLASTIGQFVDEQLNQALIESLKLILNLQNSQRNEFNKYWRVFCESGGLVRLQKFMMNTKSKQQIEKVEGICDYYKFQ